MNMKKIRSIYNYVTDFVQELRKKIVLFQTTPNKKDFHEQIRLFKECADLKILFQEAIKVIDELELGNQIEMLNVEKIGNYKEELDE